MTKKSPQPYKEWLDLKNDKPKKELMDSLKKAGIPLELKTRKILEENHFRCLDLHYLDPTDKEVVPIHLRVPYLAQASRMILSDEDLPIHLRGTWRQLDINAYRNEKSVIKFHDAKIHFTTHLIGECKYSSNKDFFVFENISDPVLSRFPVMFNGNKLIPPFPHNNFSFPIVMERVTEVDVPNHFNPKNNFNDRITHEACEQIMSALSYLYDRKKVDKRLIYRNLLRNSPIERKWQNFYSENKEELERTRGPRGTIPETVIDKFLEESSKPKDLRDFHYINIELGFPILVIDESRGVIKTVLNESNNIVDLEDIGYGIYTYISENANRYENILQNRFAFPILICNLSYLNECVKNIGEGMKKVIKETEEQIKERPWLIPKEVMFGE